MIIDAHFHCWQLQRGDYAWLTPALAPIYRDVQVADWQAASQVHGVRGGVLVQAAPTEAETWFLLQQANAHADVLGVVGWVDFLATDAPARISTLAQNPQLKGLRPMLQDIADPDWILQSAAEPALRAIVDCGLVLDALVKPQHLQRVLTLAQRHPDLKIVIDHCAKPNIAAQQWQPWADDLARVAGETAAVCKLSGLLTECNPAPPPDAARRWAAHALQCFSPSRVLWGSDWPVLELASSYTAWWNEVQSLLADLPTAQRAAVLGVNARRVYGL
jgi:L-fuconolactonase